MPMRTPALSRHNEPESVGHLVATVGTTTPSMSTLGSGNELTIRRLQAPPTGESRAFSPDARPRRDPQRNDNGAQRPVEPRETARRWQVLRF
jgi:hypothetical protein